MHATNRAPRCFHRGLLGRGSAGPGRGRVEAAPFSPSVPAQAAALPRPTLALMCKFSDNPNEYTVTQASIQAMMIDGAQSIDGYVREMSLGTVSLAGSRVVGWLTLPQTKAFYTANTDITVMGPLLAQDCEGAAAAQVDLAAYTYFVLFFNDDWGNTQGFVVPSRVQANGQTKNVPTAYLNYHALSSPPLVLHEMGHLFGGNHTDSNDDPLGGGAAYGDDAKTPRWDPPLKIANIGPGYIAYNRDLMGWIPANRKFVYQGGTQRVQMTRLTQPGPTGMMMITIPIGGGPATYTVEARTRIGYDGQTILPDFPLCQGCPSATTFGFSVATEGVLIHRIDDPNADPASHIVMSNPAGDPTTADGVWLAGQTFTDAANNLSIRIKSFDANGAVITINPQ